MQRSSFFNFEGLSDQTESDEDELEKISEEIRLLESRYLTSLVPIINIYIREKRENQL